MSRVKYKKVFENNFISFISITKLTLLKKMIRNVSTRRREYGPYLATARRHRRRLKMQKSYGQ